MGHAHSGRRFDAQTYFIDTIKKIVIVLLVGLAVKYFLFDSTIIKNDQMAPGILYGDNVLVFRTLSLPVVRTLFPPPINSPVLFDMPQQKDKRNCLRIAAQSGDAVMIDSANAYLNGLPSQQNFQQPINMEILPEEYSPRDHFTQYTIPSPGDTILMETLLIRDFFFMYSIIRQESKAAEALFKVDLLIDDSISNDYIINGFSLYSGSFENISDPLRHEWFFWVQLERYLKNLLPDNSVTFRFSVTEQDIVIRNYVVKESFVFLLADNWTSGFDSRYFGPVKKSLIIGRPFMVWWSKGKSSSLKSIRISRIGRMVL